MAVTLFGGLLDILRISDPLASNPSYHKVEWIRSTGDKVPKMPLPCQRVCDIENVHQNREPRL
jgi:hypothetical protein